MLIPIARANLRITLGTLLPNEISTWQKFTDGVRGVSFSRLTEEADRDRSIEAATSPQTHDTSRPTERHTTAFQPKPIKPQEMQPADPITPKQTTIIPTQHPRRHLRALHHTCAKRAPPPPYPCKPSRECRRPTSQLSTTGRREQHPFPNTEEGHRSYGIAFAQ